MTTSVFESTQGDDDDSFLASGRGIGLAALFAGVLFVGFFICKKKMKTQGPAIIEAASDGKTVAADVDIDADVEDQTTASDVEDMPM